MTTAKHEAAPLEKQVADLRIALQLALEASKDLRRAGRAEALAILLAHGAENIVDFIGSHPIADSGDYGEHWDEPKLRELLDVTGDDPTLSLIDRLDGRYWDQVAEIDALRERIPAKPSALEEPAPAARGWGFWGSVTVPAGGAPAAPAASSNPTAPVIYVDDTGKLVSRVSGEQVESVLGPVVDEIRARMARQGTHPNRYAGEGPISALYGIRYVASTLEEARTIASDAMDAWKAKPRAQGPARDPKSSSLPREPLWDRKGNVIHAAVNRLGAAQRAAAASAGEPEDTSAEAPKP